MSKEFRITRDTRNALKAETNFLLEGDRYMQITTSKSERGLGTTSSVHKRDGDFLTFVIFQDFFERTIPATKVRVTEKTVRETHLRALADVDGIIARANAHYAAKT